MTEFCSANALIDWEAYRSLLLMLKKADSSEFIPNRQKKHIKSYCIGKKHKGDKENSLSNFLSVKFLLSLTSIR